MHISWKNIFCAVFAFVHKARQYTQNRNMSHVAHKPSIFGAKNVDYTGNGNPVKFEYLNTMG